MSFLEKISTLLDEEVEDRTNAVLSEYAMIISKKHGIALDLLLKDLPETYTSTICKGTKGKGGQRCTFKAVTNGYCRHHAIQGERICQRALSSTSTHNHGPGQMFVRGCPGCESSKELIDLGV